MGKYRRAEGEWLKVGQTVRLVREREFLSSTWYKDLHDRIRSGHPKIIQVLHNEYGIGYELEFPNGERMRVWETDVQPVGEFLGLSTPADRVRQSGIDFWKEFKTVEELKAKGEELAQFLKENPGVLKPAYVEALRDGYRIRMIELQIAEECSG